MELRIPFATLLEIALFILACAIAVRLRGLILLLLVATVLAVVLDPLKDWLERFMRRGFAIAVIAIVLFAVLALFLLLVIPQTISESADLVRKLPQIAKRAQQLWPGGAAYIQSLMAEFAQPVPVRQWLPKGMMAIGAVAAMVFTLVLVLYLLVDGKRFAAWLVTFAPHERRDKIVRTLDDVRPLIFGYVRGNLITSVLSFIVALGVLLALHVPAALPLAILAFLGDFVPVAGFIVSLAPAVLLAATVSPTAAIIVAAVYVAYQACENYLISPRVYGKRLDLSPLAVVLGIAVGGSLAGPIGAVLILPFVAAWPAVEKIWLAERLPPDTIEKHEELANGGDEVADEIL